MEKVQPMAGLGRQKEAGEKNMRLEKTHVFFIFLKDFTAVNATIAQYI